MSCLSLDELYEVLTINISCLLVILNLSGAEVREYNGFVKDPRSILSNDIVSSKTDCLDSCQRLRPHCAGVSYHHIQRHCHLHLNWNLMCKIGVTASTQFTHYEVIPCLRRNVDKDAIPYRYQHTSTTSPKQIGKYLHEHPPFILHTEFVRLKQ